jgi:hypothetical protein
MLPRVIGRFECLTRANAGHWSFATATAASRQHWSFRGSGSFLESAHKHQISLPLFRVEYRHIPKRRSPASPPLWSDLASLDAEHPVRHGNDEFGEVIDLAVHGDRAVELL